MWYVCAGYTIGTLRLRESGKYNSSRYSGIDTGANARAAPIRTVHERPRPRRRQQWPVGRPCGASKGRDGSNQPPPKKDAENDAVLSIMRALSGQTPSPPWVPIGEPRRIDGPAPETAAANGSAVECSHTLHVCSAIGSGLASASRPAAESEARWDQS